MRPKIKLVTPFPFDTKRWGEITWWEETIQGVYELQTTHDDRLYLVDSARCVGVVPKDVLCQYGITTDDRYYFFKNDFYNIVQYNALLRQLNDTNVSDRERLLREILVASKYGAWYHPEYFGEWTPQTQTPWGERTRYKKATNGIWFVQVNGEWYLSLCYVLSALIIEETREYAASDQTRHRNCEDMYWKLNRCAVTIYSLLDLLDVESDRDSYYDLKKCITSMDDLECCLCEEYPEYVQYINHEWDISIDLFRDCPSYVAKFEAMKIIKREGAKSDFLAIPGVT